MLFVLVMIAVTVLICTTRRCRWMLIVTLSGSCEAAGYLCRVIFIKKASYGRDSHAHVAGPASIHPALSTSSLSAAAYVSMQVLIVITPTIFACADYELAGM